MTSRTAPVNIVAIDQENRGIVAVVNQGRTVVVDPDTFVAQLPPGGGIVVGDANVWTVRNAFSVSQYCWQQTADRDRFIEALEQAGYAAVAVANKLANTLIIAHKVTAANAVRALSAYVHEQVRRTADPAAAAEGGPLWCGCAGHGPFDSGHPVRAPRGDKSFGQRDRVVRAFLRLQNTGGYTSPFAEDVITAAWDALDPAGRAAFGMLKTRPECKTPAKLMAIAVATHDPGTGQLRTHDGQVWGANFIVRHVIGLNGVMSGTGAGSAGNPMRAVLRIRGIRAAGRQHPVDRQARADLDRHVRTVIRGLQAHGAVRPVGGDWPVD